jgi:hypothetical protein
MSIDVFVCIFYEIVFENKYCYRNFYVMPIEVFFVFSSWVQFFSNGIVNYYINSLSIEIIIQLQKYKK